MKTEFEKEQTGMQKDSSPENTAPNAEKSEIPCEEKPKTDSAHLFELEKTLRRLQKQILSEITVRQSELDTLNRLCAELYAAGSGEAETEPPQESAKRCDTAPNRRKSGILEAESRALDRADAASKPEHRFLKALGTAMILFPLLQILLRAGIQLLVIILNIIDTEFLLQAAWFCAAGLLIRYLANPGRPSVLDILGWLLITDDDDEDF